MRISITRLLIIGCFATSGCSSLFYHPTPYEYFTPEKHGLQKEDVQIPTSEPDIQLHGWYFKNLAGKSPKSLVLHFHGNAENLTSHSVSLLWLIQYDCDYLIYDYRGYGRSPGVTTPENSVRDAMEAIRWAYRKARTLGPDTQLVIVGQSLGGAISMRAVAELNHEVPIALYVADSTFLSYQGAARSLLAKRWQTWALQPLAYLTLSDRWAPGSRVRQISPTPLLVIHGDNDQVVHHNLGLEIFNTAMEPKKMVTIPKGTHIAAFGHNLEFARQTLLDEIDLALGVIPKAQR